MTKMVRAVARAYHQHMYTVRSDPTTTRNGCPADLMHQIFVLCCATRDKSALACCIMVTMAFVFQVCAVSMHHVTCEGMNFNNGQLRIAFYCCTGKGTRRPTSRVTMPRMTELFQSTLCVCFSSDTQTILPMQMFRLSWQTVSRIRFPWFTTLCQTTVTIRDIVLTLGITMSSRSLDSPRNGSCGC